MGTSVAWVRAASVVQTPWRPDLIVIPRFQMRRQSVIPRKKRGPPATGKGTPIMVRLQPSLLAQLDKWIGGESDRLSRPEAIRRLVEQALAVAPSSGSVKAGSRRQAAEMAGRTIDQLSDQTATDEERAHRKRRL